MMETPLCPHCGFDLRKDEMIELDGFRFDPRGGIFFNGDTLRLRPSWQIILATLAKAAPRPVSAAALADRTGSEGDAADVTLRTQICAVRKRLRDIGVPIPFRTEWGRGYRWVSADAIERADHLTKGS